MARKKSDDKATTAGHHDDHCWRPGPLPPGTWNWGGVVPKDHEGGGFYFADFKGDTVELVGHDRTLQADEVAFYNNSLELPPCCTAKGATRL